MNEIETKQPSEGGQSIPPTLVSSMIVALLLLIVLVPVSMSQDGTHSEKGGHSHPPAATVIASETDHKLEEIQINDNRKQAGELRDGIYYIHLEIREGIWYPESKAAAPMKIKALAEEGKPLSVPGPLMRVTEGTEIRATITNKIKDLPQELYGFYTRPIPFSTDNVFAGSVLIPPGETKEVRFNPGASGTYLYAMRDTAAEKVIRLPFYQNQSYGALIVDGKDDKVDPAERIFIIGSAGLTDDVKGVGNFVINGLSWPYTERLQYRQGETVKWRVINISRTHHSMHLHGFPFTVKSLGRITGGSILAKTGESLVVTQTLPNVGAMRIEWTPEKIGNWLFHCHMLEHILPVTFLRNQEAMDHAAMNIKTHAANGMGGLIMGITVLPDKNFAARQPKSSLPERKLTLVIGEKENYFDGVNGKGFKLIENEKATTDGFNIPGPPLILYKDQPVAIKIVNTLKEPTTIHWHGLEIESYYDGVVGWGNAGNKLAPLIQPGDSFTVHITPPRAGTFMYHTHMHDLQVLQGLYGPLIVINPGEKYDPETDKIFLISEGGQGLSIPKTIRLDDNFGKPKRLVNGTDKPSVMTLKKGQAYRFRLISITATPQTSISLKQNDQVVSWRMLAKDGMSLPKHQQLLMPAQLTADVGETYDFEFIPANAGVYRLDFLSANKKIQVTQLMTVED